MRICLITSSYPRFEEDGNARFVRSIAEAQAALGHEMHVVAPYAPEVRPYPSPVHIHWFRYVWPARWGVMGHARALENDRTLNRSVLWQAPLFSLSLMLTAQRVIRSYEADLIHAHWVLPSGFLASWLARLNKKPLFISLHGSDIYLALRGGLFEHMARTAFRWASGVTACSAELADGAVRGGADRSHIRLIPWGASPEIFDDQPVDGALRDQLGIPRDAVVVLGLGRLVAKKGFDLLICSAPLVLAQCPKTWFVFVGEGPERGRLSALADGLDVSHRVIFTGAVPWIEVPHYLQMSSIFVVPSVKDPSGNLDGLPTTVLEAMAASRPVVAANIAGMPLVVDSEETGILIPPDDRDSLSKALIRLASECELRERLGRSARAKVINRLTWRHVAEAFDRLYDV